MKRPHKHAELIKEWADGSEIQYFDTTINDWRDTLFPLWEDNNKYRVKPNWYDNIPEEGVLCWVDFDDEIARLRLVTSYDEEQEKFFDDSGVKWYTATPITSSELFIQNII